MNYCPLAFRMSLVFPVSKQQKNFMKFIYGNGVMMHVKIYKDVICVEILLPSDSLNINEFRAIHMNTHSDAHRYSLE